MFPRELSTFPSSPGHDAGLLLEIYSRRELPAEIGGGFRSRLERFNGDLC